MTFGPGISLRRSFLSELSERLERGDTSVTSRIRWVEAVPENFLGRGGFSRRALLSIAEALPVALHGVSLSIGSVDPLDRDYLAQLGALARDTRARQVTDHFCFASAEGAYFHNLLPLPFTQETLRHLVPRIEEVQDYLGIPFGLENPSYYAELPGAEMSEAEFISEVVKRTGCHLLLDVNNVFVNCANRARYVPSHGGDVRPTLAAAREFLSALPLDRIIEVHVAGYEERAIADRTLLLDTHGANVSGAVREILAALNEFRPVETLLLEREQHVPPLDTLLGEVDSLWRSLETADGAAVCRSAPARAAELRR
jgi:uncharacterized protein (UPF0276 family)